MVLANAAVLHVWIDGRSLHIPQDDLSIGVASRDAEIKQATANYLDVSVDQFRFYVVDRHGTGNVTVRPDVQPFL